MMMIPSHLIHSSNGADAFQHWIYMFYFYSISFCPPFCCFFVASNRKYAIWYYRSRFDSIRFDLFWMCNEKRTKMYWFQMTFFHWNHFMWFKAIWIVRMIFIPLIRNSHIQFLNVRFSCLPCFICVWMEKTSVKDGHHPLQPRVNRWGLFRSITEGWCETLKTDISALDRKGNTFCLAESALYLYANQR